MFVKLNKEENYCEVIEVIGNTYDNPELLEVQLND